MSAIPNGLKATTDDYIQYVGSVEAVEASNPDDPSATTPDLVRIQNALDLSFDDIRATDLVTCPAGKVLIRANLKGLMLRLTRWHLDTIKQREDIKEEYQYVRDKLREACSDELCKCDPKLSNDQITELGLEGVVCPSISFSSQGRIWKKGLPVIDNYRRGSFLRGGQNGDPNRWKR